MDESLTKIRHERSKKDFPGLTLQEDEYVEFAFSRARVCLMLIIIASAFALITILLATLLVMLSQSLMDDMGRNYIFIILIALFASTILISVTALAVYRGNQLFITNKRVIQKIMESPVSRSFNVIDLGSVEDVSFHQNGIMQNIFGYGTLRLATVGDETSYTFKYSDIKKADLDAVQKLVASAKKHSKTKKTAEVEDPEGPDA